MWKYWAFQAAYYSIGLLPMKIGYAAASSIAAVVYPLAKRTRSVVHANLKQVLGEGATPKQMQLISQGVFRNTAKNYFDLIHMPRVKLSDLERMLAVHGWHNFEDAFRKGKGVIVVTAHLGNFDLVAQIMAAKAIGFTVLVEPIEPDYLFRFVNHLRRSRGVNFLPLGIGGLKHMIRSLKRGEVVGLACDRDIQGHGFKMNFLGEEASLPLGAVDLAMRTGAALIPAFSLRQKDNRFAVYVEPPITISTNGNLQESRIKNGEKVLSVVEKYVRQNPDQWVVFQPMWQESR